MRQAEYIRYRLKMKCPTQSMDVFLKRLALELQVPVSQIVLTLMQGE
jgi:hypothetical protein